MLSTTNEPSLGLLQDLPRMSTWQVLCTPQRGAHKASPTCSDEHLEVRSTLSVEITRNKKGGRKKESRVTPEDGRAITDFENSRAEHLVREVKNMMHLA